MLDKAKKLSDAFEQLNNLKRAEAEMMDAIDNAVNEHETQTAKRQLDKIYDDVDTVRAYIQTVRDGKV